MKVLALKTHESNDQQSRRRGDVYDCPKQEAVLLIKFGIVSEKKEAKAAPREQKKDTKSTTEKISKSTRKKTRSKKIKTK